MKLNFILIFIVTVGAVWGLPKKTLITGKRSSLENSQKIGIYDGEVTTILRHPYAVAVLLYDIQYCAGTIVSDSWVLTTGDCIYGHALSDLTILAGSNDGVEGIFHDIEESIIHPYYDDSKLDYNYALLKVQSPFEWSDKVKPANITWDCPQSGTPLIVAGWGNSYGQEPGQSNGYLRDGYLTTQSASYCEEYFADFSFTWSSRMACAYNKGQSTLCGGDWGDALVHKTKKEDLKGVVYNLYYMFIAGTSEGFCTPDAGPVVLMSVCYVYDWINDTVNDLILEISG